MYKSLLCLLFLPLWLLNFTTRLILRCDGIFVQKNNVNVKKMCIRR